MSEKTNKEFKLHIGALAPKLSEQLEKQGFMLDKVDYYEKIIDARTYLYLGGFISESTCEKITQKIFKEISKRIVEV